MTLTLGTRLGPYEVLGRLGAGGMGVVYRALDTRLGREVAIKVLPKAFAEDAERLRRFELEARTTGNLNHPNLLVIFDIGTYEGEPYLVMELLTGETLHDRLAGKALPPKKAIEWALAIAQGLSAAHEKGIVHRDLKPENIFITREGRVKILDFGLAKVSEDSVRLQDAVTDTLGLPGATDGSGQGPGTAMGTVVGTLGYMSPEQVRGERVDGRSDLFCLGVILWEMLTGKHPFRGQSAIETLHAIIKEEPPNLDEHLKVPPLLERIVHTCLAKDPSGRFHSAHDLAFALEACAGSHSTTLVGLQAAAGGSRVRRALPWGFAVTATGLLGLGLAWTLGWPPFRSDLPPTFTRLTFAQGTVGAARFSGDGRSVFYSGRFQGATSEIYLRTPESQDSLPLQSHGAELLAVSSTNELAVLRETVGAAPGRGRILAQMPGGGGKSRDLLENVLEAAWHGDGKTLAVLTEDSGFNSRLESPPGTALHTSKGTLKFLRSPRRGDRLAVVDGTGGGTDILLFDAAGVRKTLHSIPEDAFGATITGLAWSPDERELWFSERQGDQTAWWGLNLKGRRRLLWRSHGDLQLLDAAEDGRILAAAHQTRIGVFYQASGTSIVRDLSILDGTQAMGFTPDGKSLLLLESPSQQGGTPRDGAYLRDLEGGSPVRLADGNPRSLSPDGRHVGLNLPAGEGGNGSTVLTFVPTGAGQPEKVAVSGNFEGLDDGLLFQNGSKVLFAGMEKESDWRFYTMDRSGAPPRPFTPVGVRAPRPLLLSPDGRTMVGTTITRGKFTRYPLDGSKPRSIQGVQPGETPFAWSADGRSLLVASPAAELPLRIHRLDPDTGKRSLVHTLDPPDPAGYLRTLSVRMQPNGRGYAFTFRRRLSELLLVDGLR